MKLKRFLSLAVSLAMVIAMIPAFSLTASAAGTTDVITALGGEVLWSCPDGSFNDTAIGTAFSGWSSNITSGYVNVKTYSTGNTIQYYVNGTENKTTITSPGYGGNGEDAIVIEWTMKRDNPNDLYFDFSFFDKDGAEIAFVKLDRNYTSVTGDYKMGCPTTGAKMAIVATNNDDGTHTNEYYVDGVVVNTETKSGTVNGFGGITSTNGRWSAAWNHIGFCNLAIGAVSFSETRVDVEAQYTVNGEVVHTATGNYDPAEGETGVTFPAYGYSANGSNVMYATDGATLSESGEIALQVVANNGTHAVGDIFAKDGVQYEIKSANLVPNGDFSYGLYGWYNSANGAAGADKFAVNGNGTITGKTNEGTAAAGSLHRAWALESGKQYLFTWTADVDQTYHKVSVKDELTGTADGTVVATSVAGTNNYVFTAANNYIQINFRWLGGTNVIGNFGLYEIAEAEVAVQETVASVAEIAPVKVIGDTTVVLPSTVSVTGSLGTEVDAPIVWDAPASYTTGTTTVEGVATVQFGTQDATTQAVSTTVTVLEETFTLSDITTVNGQDAGKASQVAFPVAIADEFNMEFVATYASFGDLWITIKTKDAGFFSPEQIPLGVNASGAFRPVNGNGSGGRTVADSDLAYLTTGTPYRFFITTDASTDKYTVSIFDVATGAEVVTAENFGYRTNADAIECITSITNNGAGSVTLTDIKVNANVEKTEYTVNITLDGETNTTTASYWSAEEAVASVADIPGYEKTVTVDGTIITVVYSATQTLAATFVDANENVIKAVSEVVAIGETYTVVAEEIFFLDENYNGYFYQIPEIVLSADNNNLVITVTETANKYAAMEDMLVSDNEVWGMKATNSNSVFVAAGADANRGPLTDANGENNHDANHTPSTLGKSRVGFFQFPVVDVEEGNKVTANFYVREWHGNGFSNSNQTLRLAAYAVNDSSWVELSDGGSYDSANAPIFEGYTNPVFSQVCYNNVGYIAFDITEMMMAAKEAGLETITLRLNAPYGAAYIAEREAAVVGGAYAGNAAYIAVEDAGLVKVTETGYATLTKNGSDVNGVAYVAATDDVRLAASGAIVIGTDAGYVVANENLNLTEATAFENTVPAGLGLAMVGGAQVRIGATELEEDAKLDALADSGLRFLATADYADTVLADDAVEFGIKVQAEASDAVAYVKAETFQNDDNNVFSAAITNMKESNYNRKYTAVAYALVPMADGTVEEFTTDSVTRSIYQVSAGIMKNGTADADNAAYTVDGVVKNILNAYVNQTGIRLTYTADGIAVEDGKYTGDVFFAVESTVNEDGSVAVTITPDASWGTPAEIATWWTDYVRVNNNNSVAKTYISDAAVDEAGVLTFTFTVPANN